MLNLMWAGVVFWMGEVSQTPGSVLWLSLAKRAQSSGSMAVAVGWAGLSVKGGCAHLCMLAP